MWTRTTIERDFDQNNTQSDTEIPTTQTATTTSMTTLLLNNSIRSFIGSWKITYEDGFESILNVDSRGYAVVTSAHGKLAGSLIVIDSSENDWKYEILSESQAESKFHLKMVDAQLVARRWTGSQWIPSASVQMTTPTEESGPSTPASSTIPVWIFVLLPSIALAALVACLFAYRLRKCSSRNLQQHMMKEAGAAAPPVLLSREISAKTDKTAEFGTSPAFNRYSLGSDDIELEFGLGDVEPAHEFTHVSSLTCPQENAPSFQGPSRESVFGSLDCTVTSI